MTLIGSKGRFYVFEFKNLPNVGGGIVVAVGSEFRKSKLIFYSH